MRAPTPPPVLGRGHRGQVAHRVGDFVGLGLVVAWLVTLGAILRHRLFVSHDTLINYAHVWFISDRLWHGHGLAYRMPVLSHGEAFAFPYGLVPWLLASVARPILGDRVVTLTLVTGAVLLVVATFSAFPELRRGWWAAVVLVNPALVVAVLIGQIPFMWATALFLGGVACWRRGRWGWATALVALAQVTHAAVLIPIAAVVVAVRLVWEPERGRLLRQYALSLVPALPAVWIVWRSPVFVEASASVKVANFLSTVAPRSMAVAVPIALVLLSRHLTSWITGSIAVVLLVGLNAVLWHPLGMPWAWKGLEREPDTRMVAFTRSTAFTSGATYRVLRNADGKVGMYQLLRAGAALDAEFFPESIVRRSWPDPAQYTEFLRRRKVDFVMIWFGYTRKYRTNEQRLLETMARHDPADCAGPVLCVHAVRRAQDYTVYGVT